MSHQDGHEQLAGGGTANAELAELGERTAAAQRGREELAKLRDQVAAIGNPRVPQVNDDVIYVSYGTPGGEYAREERAAKVTSVGAWITTDTVGYPNLPNTTPPPVDGDERTLVQRYDAAAVTLFVMNPEGLFLRGVPVEYDSGRDESGAFTGYGGGTWHWREDERIV